MRKKQIAQHLQRQLEIKNKATAEGRNALNEEEQREFNELQGKIDKLMAEEIAEQARTAAGTVEGEASSAPAEEAIRTAIEAERSRISEITALCRDFDMETEAFINDGNTIDEVRAAVLTNIMNGHGPASTAGGLHVESDEGTKYRAAASDALLLRAGVSISNPADGSSELRGLSLRDFAIDALSRDGNRNPLDLLRMSSDDLFEEVARQAAFNPTAAFPAILDATIQKSIVELYNKVPTTFEEWTTTGTLRDFKTTADHEYVIGGAGDFELVPENGELKADKPSTALLPNRKLDTYGRQFSMTRQAFINDDVDFITKVPGLYASSAKKTIDKNVYKILFNNIAIFDGHNLFDASNHKNYKSSGAAPSAATIQEAITKMQLQKDQFGDAITVTPAAIVVPVGYGFTLKTIFHSAQIVGSANNDINVLYNYPIKIVETPVLNALAGSNACPWFLVADPSTAKGIQVDYLNGNKTPITRRAEVPGTLGFVWDIYLDWGISVLDYRGLYKNAGTALS